MALPTSDAHLSRHRTGNFALQSQILSGPRTGLRKDNQGSSYDCTNYCNTLEMKMRDFFESRAIESHDLFTVKPYFFCFPPATGIPDLLRSIKNATLVYDGHACPAPQMYGTLLLL